MKEKRMINLKLQHPPPGDPLAFESVICAQGGEEIELCLNESGILTWTVKSFSAEYTWFIF